jgi:peptidoglycan hydrolase-like protein with peptidoglycan-binding domain
MLKRFVIGVLLFVPLVASAATVEELQAQIAALLQQIQTIQHQNQYKVVTGGACPALYRTIQYGSRGEDVASLQRYLISIGLLAAGNDSGYFGVLTERAVQSFQETNGIVKGGLRHETGFGVVGPATMRAIAKVCATGQYVQTTLLPTPTYTPAQSYYYQTGDYTSCTWKGTRMVNGETVRAYEKSLVPKGDTCKRETRTCMNGTLSGSFQNASCSVEKGTDSCTFNNVTIGHGTSILAYEAASVSGGASCKSEIRKCDDGELTGSYTHALCTGGATTYSQGSYYSQGTYYSQGSYSSGTSCTLDGATVPHGKSRPFYHSSPGGYDGRCSSIAQTRTCTNGSLSGDSAYSKAVCKDFGTTLTAAPASGPAPLKVTFTVPHTSNSGGVFPTISFGDGASYTPTGDASASRYWVDHTYNSAGTYTVRTSGGFSYDPHEVITVSVQ